MVNSLMTIVLDPRSHMAEAIPADKMGCRCVIPSEPKGGEHGNVRSAMRARGSAILAQIAEPRTQAAAQAAQARMQQQQEQQQDQLAHQMVAMALEPDYADECFMASFWGTELDQTQWDPWALNAAPELFAAPPQAACLPNLLSQSSACQEWPKVELARLGGAGSECEATALQANDKSDQMALVDAAAKQLPVKVRLPRTSDFPPMQGLDPQVPARKRPLLAGPATGFVPATADLLAPARMSVSSFLLETSSPLTFHV